MTTNKIEETRAEADERDAKLADLLARCALRDQNALRLLYQEVAAKLNGIAFRITRAQDIAEDVLQISFTQIWNDAESYRPDKARPLTWMASIVRHRALDRRKAERRRGNVIDEHVELEADELASGDRGPMEHFALNESSTELQSCLQRLSERQQQAVMLAYYYGYSRDEVAAKLNSAVGTVKSWLHRGLQRLEQCLAQ